MIGSTMSNDEKQAVPPGLEQARERLGNSGPAGKMKKELTVVIKLGMALASTCIFNAESRKKGMLTIYRNLVHCRRGHARAAAFNTVHNRRDGRQPPS